jgi:hypothetical protein
MGLGTPLPNSRAKALSLAMFRLTLMADVTSSLGYNEFSFLRSQMA